MAIMKCKMCGGNIEVSTGITVAECEYCGTNQTLPKADDEIIQNLFNRANNLRIKCEFDKAEQIYEKILQKNDTESEAHWGIVLCKYGIEYVEDPKTYKRIPTCHRTSYDAIVADADYLAALQHADLLQKSIYEAEAKAIDEIQKSILNIVKNEKPFDVFICYKETDENGRRTVDSAIANDIYYQLTQEGLKVFYAAITLEDKLGQEYEPYIFAALNSAKVMLVIGTQPQYFSAVWVKNEWNRFLKLMKSDRNKLLIPCYRDMDAYDLPEEFAHLQAQDMSKIGFINDVVRGIRKIVVKQEVQSAVANEKVTVVGNTNTAPLLERAFMFLEDGEWNSANEYCEKVLDLEPKNAQAYLGKLMAELNVKTQEGLRNCAQAFDEKNNYQKVIRFADEALITNLQSYLSYINARNERALKEAEETEKEKKRISEEKKTCEALIEELDIFYKKEKEREEKRGEIEEQVASLETDIGNLIFLKDSWNQKEKELQLIRDEIGTLEKEISKTQDERKRLGIFGAKQKKEFTQRILDMEEEISSLIQKETFVLEQRKGYGSFEEVCNDLDLLRQKTNRLRSSIERQENERSDHQIREELKRYKFGKGVLKTYDEIGYFKTGRYVKFGSYYHTKTGEMLKEKIVWRVLDVRDGRALVISKYALDRRPYNTENVNTTWDSCTLRTWLNTDFLNEAFSVTEQSVIPMFTVSADRNPRHNTDQGMDTRDKIFLLSIPEVNRYFPYANERVCKLTEYATASSGHSWWWLRTSGGKPNHAVHVYSDGGINELGRVVYMGDFAVRPAMWIDLDVLYNQV